MCRKCLLGACGTKGKSPSAARMKTVCYSNSRFQSKTCSTKSSKKHKTKDVLVVAEVSIQKGHVEASFLCFSRRTFSKNTWNFFPSSEVDVKWGWFTEWMCRSSLSVSSTEKISWQPSSRQRAHSDVCVPFESTTSSPQKRRASSRHTALLSLSRLLCTEKRGGGKKQGREGQRIQSLRTKSLFELSQLVGSGSGL